MSYAKNHLRSVVLKPMQAVAEGLEALKQWDADAIDGVVKNVTTEQELKYPKGVQPLRIAATGGASSPAIGLTLQMLGKTRTLERIARALSFVEQRSEEQAGNKSRLTILLVWKD